MSKKTKTRAANYPVPRNAQEASDMLAELGRIKREATRREQDYGDRAAALKDEHEADLLPLRDREETLSQGVILWATAQRDMLTQGGKVKTATLPAGSIAWRHLPPSVKLKGMDAIIAYCRANKLTRFIRASETVNKEAMLSDKDVARTVPGVRIGSDGEEIILTPHYTDEEIAA